MHRNREIKLTSLQKQNQQTSLHMQKCVTQQIPLEVDHATK